MTLCSLAESTVGAYLHSVRHHFYRCCPCPDLRVLVHVAFFVVVEAVSNFDHIYYSCLNVSLFLL